MKRLMTVIAAFMLIAAMLAGCTDNTEIPDDTVTGTEVPKEENGKEPDKLVAKDTAKPYVQEYLDIISEYELENSENGSSYDLIDVNGDDTPELVASYPGCINLYTYIDGKLYTLMDRWMYGAMGNAGYTYLPGKNIVRNMDSDMAGALVYETYFEIDEKNKLEYYYDEALYTQLYKDKNGNGYVDEEEIDGNTYYFYGSDEITKAEYEEKLFTGGFISVYGTMSYEEITDFLTGKTKD